MAGCGRRMYRGGGGGSERIKFGMANFRVVKIWRKLLNITAKLYKIPRVGHENKHTPQMLVVARGF